MLAKVKKHTRSYVFDVNKHKETNELIDVSADELTLIIKEFSNLNRDYVVLFSFRTQKTIILFKNEVKIL